MKIERFEEIVSWQKSRELVKLVYDLVKGEGFRKDYGLRDQIQRASVSVMANIAEGFDSKSKAEFLHFLTFARRSASEVQSHLYVALDEGYIDQKRFDDVYLKLTEVKNLIGGFIRYLSSTKG